MDTFEAKAAFLESIKGIDGLDFDRCETDKDGQVVVTVHTGIYRWKDGSYHFEPEQSKDSDEDDLNTRYRYFDEDSCRKSCEDCE